MDEKDQVNSIIGEAPDLEAEIAAYEEKHPDRVMEPEVQEPVEEADEADDEPAQAISEPKVAEEKEKSAETVPLAVFLDLKNELKEVKRQQAEAARQQAEAARPKEGQKAPEGPPKFEPSVSYNDDPAEFLRQRTEYLEQYIAWQSGGIDQAKQLAEQQRQMQEAQQGYRSFANTVTVAEEQFRTQAPDYDEAVDFVRSSRFQEAKAVYEANGIEINPQHEQQIRAAITQEFAALAQNALQNGRNPASVLYTLAKARGFSPQPPQSQGVDNKVSRIERGVERSRSSQAIAGTRPGGGGDVGGEDFFRQLQRDAGYRR